MKRFLLTVLICWPAYVIAQSIKDSGQTKKWISHSTIWYSYKVREADKMNLPRLINSDCAYYTRYWKPSQIVEIWSSDGVSYNGSVIDYIESYSESGYRKRKSTVIYYHTTDLSYSLATKAYAVLQNAINLPAQDSIKGWEQGLDGVTYIFETSTPQHYSLKAYWTPEIQPDSIAEVMRLRVFNKEIAYLLQLQQKNELFIAALPGGSYTDGGIVLTKFSSRVVSGYRIKSKKGPRVLLP